MMDTCVDYSVVAAGQQGYASVVDENWPPGAIGGNVPPVRSVADPFVTFDGIALDPVNDRVIVSDENLHSLPVYDRRAGSFSDEVTEPVQYIFGPKTLLGYIAGVAIDPAT